MRRFGNHYAAGRLKTGQMNKTETRYAEFLEGQKVIGLVLWYKFEGFKLRLADNTFLTPDFIVLRPDGLLEAQDVKATSRKRLEDGSYEEKAFSIDDSKAKIKVAAELYPLIFAIVFQSKSGEWIREEI